MKMLRFDQEVGKEITAFDSKNLIMSRIIKESDSLHISCMFIGPDGVVGHHQALGSQLFLVVSGEGFVRGKEDIKTPIKEGQAAFWEPGEWHETTTEKGMTAIVIEGENIDVSALFLI
ncbi:cupin domain-containing protein [Chengkuizengella sediminis]|uniref:cupin domain-containing protein n=1 Tax=Chengkuizengella sediminis TaxID=1885917 RepID=UPI001389C6B3|nr:cupin domain-containing protein [Chengkuizengella sediminis]NDI33845.1 cupin domain-containing protein [Chengkuizengella sediminis]